MSSVCAVDDDLHVLRLLGRCLASRNVRVDLLEGGSTLLSLVAMRHFDLIILDLGLPDADGYALLEILGLEHPEIRVMVVSARDDVLTRVRCLDAGACDFVGKPFELSELLARVRVHLRAPAETRAEPPPPGREYLLAGTATLDLVAHRLRLPEGCVELTPREFLLIRHLIARSGSVCTRNELLREVWGFDFETDSNVVDKYISRIRQKLPVPLIKTVPSVGYVVEAT